MPIQLDGATRRSLDHLIEVAQGKTESAARVSSFLLAWHDVDEYGGFGFSQLWEMDNETLRACSVVFLWVASHRATPADLGYEAAFAAIKRKLQPNG